MAEACTLRQVLDHVGGKWSVPILLAAIDGPVRFSQLERLIQGISRRMLTLTLRNLERDGLLIRTVYPTVPPKVEYTATEMARELHGSLRPSPTGRSATAPTSPPPVPPMTATARSRSRKRAVSPVSPRPSP